MKRKFYFGGLMLVLLLTLVGCGKKEEKKEEKEEELKKEEKEVKNLKAGNYTLDFGTYKSSNTDVTGGFYSIKADGTYTYTNSNVLEKGKRVTVNENGKYEIKNMVFDEDKDTGEIYSKGWAICMTSSAKTKRSEACWQISQSNSFQAINSSNTWTLQK